MTNDKTFFNKTNDLSAQTKLRMPEISRTAEPDLSRGWSVVGSRDSGRSNKINCHERFSSVQENGTLNKTPEACTIHFTSRKGYELIVSGWNIQHANRVGLGGIELPSCDSVFADEGNDLRCRAVGERVIEMARRKTSWFKVRSFEESLVEESSVSWLRRKSLAKVETLDGV
jgi:hypothetical protein